MSEASFFKPSFTSDNNSGILPEVLSAIQKVASGHLPAYGREPITQQAIATLQSHFGKNSEVYFVFNGTAANVCGLEAICQSHHSVLCSAQSHLCIDEGGAPEKIAGLKLIPVNHPDGKVHVEDIDAALQRRGDPHCRQLRAVSLTQPTEYGELYSYEELRQIIDFAHSKNLWVHMDGSRLVNAAVSLNLPLSAISSDIGVDVLSFGGTKNGLMWGDAVLFFRRPEGTPFAYLQKQNLQLAGKMRFLSAQFSAWLADDVWQKHARHSLDMAKKLRQCFEAYPQLEITRKTESNAVFVKMPRPLIRELRQHFYFYVWDEKNLECRLMTSFDTSESDLKAFASILAKAIEKLKLQ